MFRAIVFAVGLFVAVLCTFTAPSLVASSTTAPITAIAVVPKPRKLRFKDATRYSGISRSVFYELAPQYPGLLTKQGGSTYVDVPILDTILDAQPIAKIKVYQR
jgi:hypothetical protein